MTIATGGRDDTAPMSSDDALTTYRDASRAIRSCLDLGDEAAAAGNACRAVEYLLGVIRDLDPELAKLAVYARIAVVALSTAALT